MTTIDQKAMAGVRPLQLHQHDSRSLQPEVVLRPGEQTQISLHEHSRSHSSDESLVSVQDVLSEGPQHCAGHPQSSRIPRLLTVAHCRSAQNARQSTSDLGLDKDTIQSVLPEPLRVRRAADYVPRQNPTPHQWLPSHRVGVDRRGLTDQPGLSPAFYHKPKDLSRMGIPPNIISEQGSVQHHVAGHMAAVHSRSRSRGRDLIKDVRRLSARLNSTPGDILWPGEAMTGATDDRSLRVVSQTLGQSRRSPILDPEVSYMDLDSIDERYAKDSSRRARLIAVCGFLVTMNTWGLANAFSMFLAYYQTVLLPGHSADQLSWIGSIQLFLLFFMGAPSGIALDRGQWRIPFQGGAVCLLAGMIGKGFCTRYWHFIVVEGIVTGLGMGLLFCSGAIMLMNYFEKRVGIAMAFAATGAGIGAIIHSAIFEAVTYYSTASFAWASRGNALFAAATLIWPALFVHPHPDAPVIKRSLSLKAISDKAFNTVILGFWWAFLGLYFAFYFIVPYGFRLGMHGPQALLLIVALYVPNLVSRIVAGVLSDRYTGPLNLVIVSCCLTAGVTILWIWITSKGGLFATAAFYGLASGGVQALYSATFHSFTFKDPSTMNVKSGLAYTVISFACLIGTPIGGRLVRADDNGFLGAQLFSGVCLSLAAAILLLARYFKVKFAAVRI